MSATHSSTSCMDAAGFSTTETMGLHELGVFVDGGIYGGLVPRLDCLYHFFIIQRVHLVMYKLTGLYIVRTEMEKHSKYFDFIYYLS